MKLNKLTCPACGAIVTPEDGIETFYCMHCGSKLILEGQSDSVVKEKVRLRIVEEKLAHERYKMKKKREDEEYEALGTIALIVLGIVAILIILLVSGIAGWSQNHKLDRLTSKVQAYIKKEDFDSARLEVNKIIYSGSDSTQRKIWDKTREELQKQIESAEKASKKANQSNHITTYYPSSISISARPPAPQPACRCRLFVVITKFPYYCCIHNLNSFLAGYGFRQGSLLRQ